MNKEGDALDDLQIARRAKALEAWVSGCRTRMHERWPEIDFDSNHWPLMSSYKTRLKDVNFAPALADFQGKDPAYGLTLKCIMAEVAFKGDIKDPEGHIPGWRLLSRVEAPLHQLRRAHLTELEDALVKEAKGFPSKASRNYRDLMILRVQIDLIGAADVTDRMAWSPSPQSKSQLRAIGKSAGKQFRAKKAFILDRQIEALSDAQTAMFRGDDRLSAFDRVSLAVMGLNMCCPNRVNEPLCMAADDRFTLEDYLVRGAKPGVNVDSQTLERVHQMLLVKGSKGAAWGAKPILNFMIAFSDLCIDVIKQHGEVSRMLVNWYEKNPDILYLPAELEHLRGTDIDMLALWKIMHLETQEVSAAKVANVKPIWNELLRKGFIRKTANPRTHRYDGTKNTRTTIQTVAWSDLESTLLARVKQSMEDVRRVTPSNHYQGRLSNMLMLVDGQRLPYIPGSIKYTSLCKRLSQTENDKKPRTKEHRSDWRPEPTLFEKLGIKMVVNGAVETAYIHTHDPRRWLTGYFGPT